MVNEIFLLGGAEQKAIKAAVEGRTMACVARTALAVEKWRMEHGHWPDSLRQMAGDTLDAVPQDPYSDTTLICRRTDTGCIVYSIGPDDKDQGGISEAEAMPKLKEARKWWSESGWLLGEAEPPPLDAYDLPFRLLDPELRGAKTATFRDEVLGSGVSLDDLKEAGLDEDALRHAGLTDDDLKKLQEDQ